MAITNPGFPPLQNVDQKTYSDDMETFLMKFSPMADDLNVAIDSINTNIDAATLAASNAVNSAQTSATSTTSLTCGTGSKSLTLAQTGKLFSVGQTVNISDSTAANVMNGRITAFNSGTGAMTVNVLLSSGTSTLASWIISVGGSTLGYGTTGIVGMIKGDGSVFSQAVAGTDFLAPSAIGTTVQAQMDKLNNYHSSIVTFASAPNSPAIRAIALDADRDLILVCGAGSLHAVVNNNTAKAIGAGTLVRASGVGSTGAIALKIATDKVLVVSITTTALQAVILTISGTTITVNTAASATITSASAIEDIIACGSSYIVTYKLTSGSTNVVQAMTVSGTTVTVGSALNLSGTGGMPAALLLIDATHILTASVATSTFYALPVTVSGTTLTAGTAAVSAGNTSPAQNLIFPLSSGRWAAILGGSAPIGMIITVSGTTATATSASLSASATVSKFIAVVVGSQAIVASSASTSWCINVLTDNAGTAVAGTEISAFGDATYSYLGSYNNELLLASANNIPLSVGISGNNPTASYKYGGAGLAMANAIAWASSGKPKDLLPGYCLQSAAGVVHLNGAASMPFWMYNNGADIEFIKSKNPIGSNAYNAWTRTSNNSAVTMQNVDTSASTATRFKFTRVWID